MCGLNRLRKKRDSGKSWLKDLGKGESTTDFISSVGTTEVVP
jgi:hypothetical protein